MSKMACNPYKLGCSLFQKITSCQQIFGTANIMLNHIRALGDTSVVHGYMIHSPCFQNINMTSKFWQVQAATILDLCLMHLLSIIVATVHPDLDGCGVKTFSSNLKSKSIILSLLDVQYPDGGNTNAGGSCTITANHLSCASTVKPPQLLQPPLIPPHPLDKFIWEPFNRKECAI
jgi:hypothetical protein